ncbi:MAG: GerMN domain-containing protein [Candidatus Eisenbacteria bacterium]|nr:GerMN domain-containing protein [Candidatus Eisenbacteria bacterium]
MSRGFRWFVVALILAVLAWLAWRIVRRAENAVVARPAASDSIGTGFRSAQLFFVARPGDSLVSESREMIEQAAPHDRVAALVTELAHGPSGPGAVAVLPPGTAALRVYLDDRGLLTLDLSPAFREGFRGGSSGEYLVVASLVRTISANLPEVKKVLLVCGGMPLPTLGGHLPLDRPLDVSEW